MKKIIAMMLGLAAALALPVTGYARDYDREISFPVSAVFKSDPGRFNINLKQEEMLHVDFSISKDQPDLKESLLDVSDIGKLESGIDITSNIVIKGAEYEEVRKYLGESESITEKMSRQVFDISVITSYSDSDTEKNRLEIPGAIRLEFTVPKDLDSGKAGDARLLHIHENSDGSRSILTLPVTYDNQNRRMSFETSKFSRYVFLYEAVNTSETKEDDNQVSPDQNDSLIASDSVEEASDNTPGGWIPALYRAYSTWDETRPMGIRIIIVIIALLTAVALVDRSVEKDRKEKTERYSAKRALYGHRNQKQ